jgi:predicted esterase
MALRPSTRFARAFALGVLASSLALPAYASSETDRKTFEPPLRELWTRGSERFQRQWLVAGPVSAVAAKDLDPASLHPAAGEALTSREPAVRWAPHTAWTDVTDPNAIGGRAPESGNKPVDRFVFAAASLPSSAAGPMELSIGSERPYAVWLNGKLVHTRDTSEAFAPDRDRISVTMKQGENSVLFRFHETSAGSSQFALRAVPPGAALKKIDEITPSLVESKDGALAVRTHFALENDASPVSVEVLRAGGEVVAKQRTTRGEVVRFDSQSWRAGAHEIRVTTQDAWGDRKVRHLSWYKGDAIAAVRRLIGAADKAEDTPRGDTIRMLAAMAKDRLGGSADKATPASWRLVHSPLMEFEELELEARGRTGRVRGGGFVRLAYTDEVDGSTQFCRAFLPLEYAKDNEWPLIAFLHGFNPANPEYTDWWSVDERHSPVTDARDTILIEPHGRGNAQYLGIGDRDVMRCIAEAKQRFSIDEDRVYLTGESMGGHGTWAIASRHPDVFAAAAPVYGGWDFRITNVTRAVTVTAPTTQMSAFGLERSSSFSHAENLLHVPLLVVHGDADASVHVENSRHAVKLLQRWGYNVRYYEMPGWAHEDLGQRLAIADWLLTHKRASAARTVRLRSPDLAGASAYWVNVRAYQRPAEIIRVNAEVMQPGVIRVDSTNVAALSLDVPKPYRGSSATVQIIWNGKVHAIEASSGRVELGTAPDAPLHKRPGLEGSLPAAIERPFAVVVGTISPDARMRETIQARADWFAQQWLGWQKHPLRVLKDTEISREHERQLSLILLGGADANAVTKRLANQLPFSGSPDGIVVDGRKFAVPDSVLQAIYPSPFVEDQYVYVVAATSADGMYFWKPQIVNFIVGFPITHFDWLIQDGRRPPPGATDTQGANVALGVFDVSWRRQDRWTVIRDEAIASKWTLRRAPSKNFVASPEALQAAAGRYELFSGFVLTFRVEDGNIIVDVPGEPSIATIAESNSVFVDPKSGNAVEILRDEAGNVIGASVDSPEGMVLAKRL